VLQPQYYFFFPFQGFLMRYLFFILLFSTWPALSFFGTPFGFGSGQGAQEAQTRIPDFSGDGNETGTCVYTGNTTIETYDNDIVTIQPEGEFLLTRTPDGVFEVQARNKYPSPQDPAIEQQIAVRCGQDVVVMLVEADPSQQISSIRLFVNDLLFKDMKAKIEEAEQQGDPNDPLASMFPGAPKLPSIPDNPMENTLRLPKMSADENIPAADRRRYELTIVREQPNGMFWELDCNERGSSQSPGGAKAMVSAIRLPSGYIFSNVKMRVDKFRYEKSLNLHGFCGWYPKQREVLERQYGCYDNGFASSICRLFNVIPKEYRLFLKTRYD
jgi:hypothetical protein